MTDGWFDGKPLEPIAKLEGVKVASPIIRRFVQISVPRQFDTDSAQGDKQSVGEKSGERRTEMMTIPRAEFPTRRFGCKF